MNTLANRAVEVGSIFERARAEVLFYEAVSYLENKFGKARAIQYIGVVEGELSERSISRRYYDKN